MEQKFKVAVMTARAALRFARGLQLQPPEGHLWFEDPITCDTMCDPVKCNDGRTYDRWTVINNSFTQSPFTRRPFAIAVDDIDVRSWLFPKFPEQEAKFRAKRRTYRAKALQHSRDHPLEVQAAIEMLNNVLQWAPEDTECRNEREKILRDISSESRHWNSLPQEGDNQVHVSDAVSNTSNGSHTSSISILRHRRPRERDSAGDNFDMERSQTSPIPVISHEDLIRERYAQRRLPVLLFFFFCFGVNFFLFNNQ